MLKHLISTMLAVTSVSVATAAISGVKWDQRWDAQTQTLIKAQGDCAADWMADLPDNMFVAHVSIPAAHDFVTGENNWRPISAGTGPVNSTCQSATIDELLAGGIRGIDLRPGYYKPVFESAKLFLCHGADVMDITFEDGMNKLTEYLNTHPKEFFVIHIFPGRSGDEPTKSNQFYTEVLGKEEIQKYIVEFRPNLTVREARGKIVITVRDRASYLQHPNQADIQNWRTSFNDNQRPGRLNLHSNAEVSTRLHVQDISSNSEGSLDTKKAHMLNLVNFAQAQDEPMTMYNLNGLYISEWIMNFLTMQTSTISSSDNYKSNATTLNKQLIDDLGDENGRLGAGPLGIVFMDYCLNSETNGDLSVYKVIENNFTRGKDAPVVRYQIDESIDWKARPENPLAGKRIFLRNVGASEDVNYYKYFGGGADWGAHAVANYAGHYVTFEKGDNGLRLVTTFGALQNKDGQYYCDPTDGENNNGTEFLLSRTYWDGYPVYHITGQVSNKRLTARPIDAASNPYFDTPAYYVNPEAPDDNDPHQMWQLIAMTPDDEVPLWTMEGHDRISRLKEKANPERGMDATFLIPSYSFGNSDSSVSKWNLTAGSNVTAGQAAEQRGGMWRALNTSTSNTTFSLSTIVSYLPAGKYKLEFQYASTSDDVKFRLGDREAVTLSPNSSAISGLTAGSDQIGLVGEYFNASTENGRIVYEFDKTTNEEDTRELVFFRESNASGAASFYLDNLRLTYYGNNVEQTRIDLDFPNEWNTIILPFDHAVPEGLEVVEATGVSEAGEQSIEDGSTIGYHIIQYGSKTDLIKANYPYLVRNLELIAEREQQSQGAPRRRSAATKIYTFTGYPTNRKNDYHDRSGVLTGLTEPRGLNPESQGFPLSGQTYGDNFVQYFVRPAADGSDIQHEGRRAYLNGRTTPGLTGERVYFSYDSVTGITDINEDSAGADLVDVTTISGIVIRRKVARENALEGLPAGIYLITGRDGTTKEIHR